MFVQVEQTSLTQLLPARAEAVTSAVNLYHKYSDIFRKLCYDTAQNEISGADALPERKE